MSTPYAGKAPHDLHLSADAGDFLRRFAARSGLTAPEVATACLTPGADVPVLLGGSIPGRLGSPASDVDLLVLLSDMDRFIPGHAGDGAQVFMTGPREPVRAYVVRIVAGVEVDVGIVDVERVRADLTRALADGAMMPALDRRLFGRLLAAWPLNDAQSPLIAELGAARPALEARAAAAAFVDALKQLEDARAALNGAIDLAVHLARLAVEAGFMAFLAAQGVLDAGDKWLRLFAAAPSAWAKDPGVAGRLWESGAPQLFPARPTSASAAAASVEAAAAFLRAVRDAVVRNRRLAIAFAVCPQVYDA